MKLAILGLGQLGGSLALACREAMPECHLTGFDIEASHGALLRARGALDTVAHTPADAVRDADLVVLATPLSAYTSLAQAIAHALAPQALVTDVGSVKHPMQQVAALLPHHAVLGSHPIAGGEKSGPEVARAELFRSKLMITTPDAATAEETREATARFWQALGCTVLEMPVTVHDQMYAHVSHLPHVLAFLVADFFDACGVRLSTEETELRTFLRISQSNPRMWTDIFLENHVALLLPLSTFAALLSHFVRELRSGKDADTTLLSHADICKQFLPRIIASTLISTVSLYEQQSEINVRPFAGAGMRDIVSPAASAPEDALAIMSQHARCIADALEAFLPRVKAMESLIGAQDSATLMQEVTRMQQAALRMLANETTH